MNQGLIWLLRGKYASGKLLTLLFWGLVLSGWGIGGSYAGHEIQIVVRFLYFLQVSMLAFGTSWIMFPQTDMWLAQILNPNRESLSAVLLGRIAVITLGSILFLSAVIAGGKADGIYKIIIWIDAMVFSLGIALFSAARFLSVGSNSQLWQEGRKGRAMMDYLKEAGSGGAGIPSGGVPTILATGLVAITGMMSVVLQAWIQGVIGTHIPGIAGILVFIPAFFTWRRYTNVIDAEFYHSHSFYHELFKNPGGRADGGREPIPIESLYWVPVGLKPASWLTFRQLDRKFPLGRFVVMGFVVYWGLIKSGVLDLQSLLLFPVLMILAKNLVLFAIERPPYSSLWYRRTLGSGWIWMGVHVVAGLRWVVPVQILLMLTVWLVDDLSQKELMLWFILDVSAILMIAGARTVFTSLTYAKNYR